VTECGRLSFLFGRKTDADSEVRYRRYEGRENSFVMRKECTTKINDAVVLAMVPTLDFNDNQHKNEHVYKKR
jgi:hypothetical protein